LFVAAGGFHGDQRDLPLLAELLQRQNTFGGVGKRSELTLAADARLQRL
jgi:hypothetical protein